MKKLVLEIAKELKMVLTGKSLDILLPPIVFLILNNVFSLLVALIGSLFINVLFFAVRIIQRENIFYALGGLLGVIFAITLAYVNNNGSNFFLPDIIGTVILVIITIVSLIIRKPLAIWVSHITRGWDLKWFYREDVLPAYREVTIFWLFFFTTRLSIEVYLYVTSTVEELVIANIIMGFPLLITVLTISYIYGITRLRRMGGPGVDEFMDGVNPPYRGQVKGF